MVWTYLSNSQYDNIEHKSLTFECIDLEISNTNLFNELKNGYIDLINDGFFDGFTNDYDTLFISTFSPSEFPIKKDKVFKINLIK